MKKLILGLALFMFSGCTGIPQNITPVTGFDVEKYTGRWYEIARLDHSFERGLANVYAEYSLREDGGVTVANNGYDEKEKKWKQAYGKAFFTGDTGTGHLKVSFFGPFYSSYIIFELDGENYSHAFVCGYNHSYLWLLSRTPAVDDRVKQQFIDRAKRYGFDTTELIFVSQKGPWEKSAAR